MKEGNILSDELHEIIRYIIDNSNDESKYNSKIFLSKLSDLAPEYTSEIKIFKRTINDEVLTRLLSIQSLDNKDIKVKLKQEKKYLEDEYGLTEAWSLIIINSFAYSFGVDFDSNSLEHNDNLMKKDNENGILKKNSSISDSKIPAQSKVKLYASKRDVANNIKQLFCAKTNIQGINSHGGIAFYGDSNLAKYTPKGILLGIVSNGKVLISKTYDYNCINTESWRGIVKISMGYIFALGLSVDGAVYASGYNDYGQCNVSEWEDIIDIVAGSDYSIGLKKDGTVVATGNNEKGQCDVMNWTDILQVCVGYRCTIGLKKDGTVVATGENFNNYCEFEKWTNVIKISITNGRIHGLRSDGKVYIYVTGNLSEIYNVSNWSSVKDLFITKVNVYGLKENGNVLNARRIECGGTDLSKWNQVISVYEIKGYIIGLRNDGTVIVNDSNKYRSVSCNFNGWNDIVDIAVSDEHIVGLKADGTVVATGSNKCGECNINSFKNIVSVFASNGCTIGIVDDGTIVTAGLDKRFLNVQGWKLFSNIHNIDKELEETKNIIQEEHEIKITKISEKREYIGSGQTIEEAVLNARKGLNVSESTKVELEILQMPKRGLFSSKEAKVRAILQ